MAEDPVAPGAQTDAVKCVMKATVDVDKVEAFVREYMGKLGET